MRNEIYEAISMIAQSVGFRHTDLWNQNVEFIDQEEPWPMPAVFIEFDPIEWEQNTKEGLMRTRSTVRLHIVSQWCDGTLDDRFSWSKKLRQALKGAKGEYFDSLRLTQTLTNHNHEDIIEDIDVYSYKGVMGL